MLLSKIKKFVSSKAIAVLSIAPIPVGIISCAYGPEDDCCADTASLGAFNDNAVYQTMCYRTMDYDEKYNTNPNSCSMKEVDSFVGKAMDCCAPLLEEGKSPAESIAYENGAACYHESYYRSGAVPANAYTHCLLNTNPRTYACDVEASRQFAADAAEACAGKDGEEKRVCLQDSWSSGKCPDDGTQE